MDIAESKNAPRFLTDSDGWIEEFPIAMEISGISLRLWEEAATKNSVLSSFNLSLLTVIQVLMSEIQKATRIYNQNKLNVPVSESK